MISDVQFIKVKEIFVVVVVVVDGFMKNCALASCSLPFIFFLLLTPGLYG